MAYRPRRAPSHSHLVRGGAPDASAYGQWRYYGRGKGIAEVYRLEHQRPTSHEGNNILASVDW